MGDLSSHCSTRPPALCCSIKPHWNVYRPPHTKAGHLVGHWRALSFEYKSRSFLHVGRSRMQTIQRPSLAVTATANGSAPLIYGAVSAVNGHQTTWAKAGLSYDSSPPPPTDGISPADAKLALAVGFVKAQHPQLSPCVRLSFSVQPRILAPRDIVRFK